MLSLSEFLLRLLNEILRAIKYLVIAKNIFKKREEKHRQNTNIKSCIEMN